MRVSKIFLATLGVSALVAGQASADVIAYWDFLNPRAGGGGGYGTNSFPLPADQGAGQLTIEDFNAATDNGGEKYRYIQAFTGTTLNALGETPAGKALIPQGANNGMSIVFEVSTAGFKDIQMSWAQRGSGDNFTSRVFAYSTDGVSYTEFATDTGALTTTWEIEDYDLSPASALNQDDSVFFKITLDGSTADTSNNRFDNILIEGTAVPEPASLAVLAAGTVFLTLRRKRA